ncbi:MAG TPA: M23 family metallopeptidase [Candidatus Nitrosotalea sp.]|nr:M23 family metallopeptidase [Candidatus Nitrosotalea sp.]
MRCVAAILGAILLPACMPAVKAQPFHLPTANQALFEPGGEEKYFVGTVGKPWQSGTFGCVRSEGWQMHEGLDIRCLTRDSRGEPADAVLATADGTVVYFNKKPSLSNYGNYLIVRHLIDGLEIYSPYAHLKSVRADLRIGQTVKAGETIALMGRTTNTREGISRDRAHVHFELNLLVNDRFPAWYRQTFPDQRNDHGEWNGQNLLGIDPRLVLLEERKQGTNFSLTRFVRDQTELCRVLIRKSDFQWLKRYPLLIDHQPAAGKDAIAGYEVSLNYNGVAFRLVPRTASEIKTTNPFQILHVNESEYQKNPCRRLVVLRRKHWELGREGIHLLELLTY